MSRAIVAAALLLAFAVASLYLHYSAERWVSIIERELVLPKGGVATVSFRPCEGEASEGTTFLVRVEASKEVNVAVVDWEQYVEMDGRIDLYGYLSKANSVKRASLEFTYPAAMPCWPIYVVVSGEPGTAVRVVVYARS